MEAKELIKMWNLSTYERRKPMFKNKSEILNWCRIARSVKGNSVIIDSTKSIYWEYR